MPSDDAEWEEYRLYQRDILLGCLADADLLVKRARMGEADRNFLVSLLWEKRCQPWKFWRDELRARQMQSRRHSERPRPRSVAP